MPISTADLYWAAGFLDGEGSFQCLARNGQASIQANQKYLPSLKKLERIFGGHIYVHRRKPGQGFPGSKDYWLWTAQGRRAIEIMMTLYTIMSPYRRGQIEKAIQRWKDNGVRMFQRKASRETRNVQRQQLNVDGEGIRQFPWSIQSQGSQSRQVDR